jgi:hypothetical protein
MIISVMGVEVGVTGTGRIGRTQILLHSDSAGVAEIYDAVPREHGLRKGGSGSFAEAALHVRRLLYPKVSDQALGFKYC